LFGTVPSIQKFHPGTPGQFFPGSNFQFSGACPFMQNLWAPFFLSLHIQLGGWVFPGKLAAINANSNHGYLHNQPGPGAAA